MKNLKDYHEFERPDQLMFLPQKITRCIEFGCSDGLFSSIVKTEFNAECWGIDINSNSIKNASLLLDKAICGEAISVIDSLPEDYFDCLICNDFLEHLTYPDLFLKKIKKCMKKDAFLVASIPNIRRCSFIFEFLLKKDWQYKEHGILDNTHFRFFTMKSLKRFLNENNFKIELFKGTRPLSSKAYLPIFLLFDIISFGFNHDMKYNSIGVRAVFN